MKKIYRIEVEFDTESPDYDGSGDPERDLEQLIVLRLPYNYI